MNEVVLVIESSDAAGGVLAEILRRSGYSPVVATSGWEGLEMAASLNGQLKAALVDITSCVDALAAATKLEDSHPGLKVIFTGNFPSKRSTSPFLLGKPYDYEEVLTKVALAIG